MMKIGVLGTGVVSTIIGTKLIELDHEVMMRSRTATNAKAATWATANGSKAAHGTFADTARFGQFLFNCTNGMTSVEALTQAGAENMRGKILIDIANPLDFSKRMPPTLSVSNTDSLAEQIQRAFPEVKVVKTLNAMNCKIRVNPASVPGEHHVFLGGNDPAAKARVTEILKNWFGWRSVIDLGDITTARGTEQLLPIWIRLMGKLGTANFNFRMVK